MKKPNLVTGILIPAILSALSLGCFWVVQNNGAPIKSAVSATKELLTESQKERADYCQHILMPEACTILIERGEFVEFEDPNSACIAEMHKNKFCSAPIQSSLDDMRKCVSDLRGKTFLPDSCEKLSR